MRSLLLAALLAGALLVAAPLPAQQVCPNLPYLVNTPEDELMLAYNGADSPQEQVAALDKFAQAHADSKFMPCVYELYTISYLKLNDYAKVIEQGEKGLAGEHPDLMLLLNLAKAYVASGTATDTAFEVIMKAPEAIQAETTPARTQNMSDDDWKKAVDAGAQQAKEWKAYMEYAFFQLLQREPDGSKRVQRLDSFVKAYPDSPNAGQIAFNYYIAYKMANDAAKAEEYGEKAIAADPNNASILNMVADDYATRQTNLDKAEEYATKALEVAGNMKKPEGMTDEQFKADQDNQLGFAHLTLGYISFQKNSHTKKVLPAIEEFKTAVDLLGSNPALQGRALFYEGYAYEVLSPPRHRSASDALTRAAGLAGPWQSQAEELLGKVKKAMGR
jgi:tetratricopeptide (TPR) repeat protein